MYEMRTILMTSVSFALSAMVIGNAYYQKKQFYPSVVYITKSNPSMAVIYIQAFVFVILMGKLFRKVFFGQLRAAEMEHLIERSWYAVTETCLAFTVFRDDFSPKFVALFTLLLFLKCFHWLAEDRVDYMERSPVISFLFHARVVSLLMFLGVVDLYFVNHAYYSTLIKGASVQLVFGFEYAILMTIVLMTVVKYALHSVDLQSENPWENKAVYLLYSELILGFVKVVLYMVFMVIMIKVHTFPLFAIRPMYLAMRSFKKALHDVIMSRRAIRQMNTLYPEATEEELQSGDNVCIICREDMMTACKKLPCNHIFHTSCLRSWFQRQQTCPTCRMEVLRMPQPRPVPPPQPPPQQQQPQPPFPNMFQNGMPGFPQMPPVWPPPQFQPQQQPPQATQVSSTTTTPVSSTSASTSSTAATTTTSSTSTAPTFTWPGATTQTNMPFMPMFPMFMPNSFPRPPASMSGLSVEELRAMEGIERENIEARIQWLRDIQALLDGAMLLINQYNTVAANSSISGISVPRETQSPAPQSEESEVPLSSPPRGSGARPKYSSVKTESSTLNKTENNSSIDLSSLEGATGYSPPKEELIPEWEDPAKEEHGDEMDEVRRRRLEKFLTENSLTNSETKKSVAPHQD